MNWTDFIPQNLFIGDLSVIIANIIRILLIAAGVVSFFYIIIGGYQYMTAGGNAEQTQAAKTTILNAIIGLIIVIASYALIVWFMNHFLVATPPTP